MNANPDYLTSSIYHPKYNLEYYPDKLLIRSGRLLTLNGENDYQDAFLYFRNPSRHFTFLFNMFVML